MTRRMAANTLSTPCPGCSTAEEPAILTVTVEYDRDERGAFRTFEATGCHHVEDAHVEDAHAHVYDEEIGEAVDQWERDERARAQCERDDHAEAVAMEGPLPRRAP